MEEMQIRILMLPVGVNIHWDFLKWDEHLFPHDTKLKWLLLGDILFA
jgi:hypothetical protein